MSSIAQETQRIAAGSDFDGTAIASTVDNVLHSGELEYPELTAGGLFLCPTNRDDATKAVSNPADKVRMITRIKVIFGGQTAWTISILNSDTGTEVILLIGTAAADLVVTDHIELMPNERLKLTTTGAATAMSASVTYGNRRV